MQIYIGSDYAGYELKEKIKEKFNTLNLIDCGCYSKDSVDYPDIAENVCNKIINNKSLGILICGTGIGISIAANKFNNIRCALIHNTFTSSMAKKHNNANVIALGSKIIDEMEAYKIINIFLNRDFEGGRHITRLNKLK